MSKKKHSEKPAIEPIITPKIWTAEGRKRKFKSKIEGDKKKK
jgi:hypothetical protein